MNASKEEIIEIINKVGVASDVANIRGDMTLKEAGIDSLETMNVFLGVEEKFGVKIPDEDIDALTTIDSIVAYLQRQ